MVNSNLASNDLPKLFRCEFLNLQNILQFPKGTFFAKKEKKKEKKEREKKKNNPNIGNTE